MKIERMRPMRQRNTPEELNQKLKDVSKEWEKQYLRQMTKAMRSTVTEGGLIKTGQAEQIFREQLDDEYVNKWGDSGGIGFGDLIYKQLLEKYGPSMGITEDVQKPRGPIPLEKQNQFKLSKSPENIQRNLNLQFMQELQKPEMSVTELTMPWSGSVLGTKRISPEEYLLEVLHDNGLKSRLSFKGSVEPGLDGKKIQAGQKIGYLSPEASFVNWGIENLRTANTDQEHGPKSVTE